MYLDIYNMVVNILGELPSNMFYIYDLCTILMFLLILFIVASPFILLYRLAK